MGKICPVPGGVAESVTAQSDLVFPAGAVVFSLNFTHLERRAVTSHTRVALAASEEWLIRRPNRENQSHTRLRIGEFRNTSTNVTLFIAGHRPAALIWVNINLFCPAAMSFRY